MTRWALGLKLCWTLAVTVTGAPFAFAQGFDCEDVDHDCDPGDRTVVSGIRRAGNALVACARRGEDRCDLTGALAGVASPECRNAIECQVRALFAQVGGGGSSCVQQLFREGYRYSPGSTIGSS